MLARTPTHYNIFCVMDRFCPKHWHLIDYAIVRQRDISQVLVTRVMRGANCWTDHRLVIVKLRVRLHYPRRHRKEKPLNINLQKLDSRETRKLYTDALDKIRVNRYLGDFGRLPPKDNRMKDWMTSFVYNFTKCSSPTCTCGGSPPWPQVQKGILNYQAISEPGLYANTGPTPEQRDMINFFDRIEQEARDSTLQIGRMTD